MLKVNDVVKFKGYFKYLYAVISVDDGKAKIRNIIGSNMYDVDIKRLEYVCTIEEWKTVKGI